MLGLVRPVSQFDLDPPGVQVGRLGRVVLPRTAEHHAHLVPGHGDARRLAQALEGLTGLVVSLEGFRIPTLKESHRAELASAHGRLAGIATLLVELDGFLVRRGRLVEPAQSPEGIGSFGQADRGHSDGAAVAGFRQELEPSAGLVEWTQRGLGLAALLQGPAETGMAHRQVVGRDLVSRLAGCHRLGEEPPRERYGFRRPAGIDQPIDGGRSGQVAGVAPAGILQSRGRALAHRYRALEGTGPAQVLKQGLHRACLVDHRLHADRAARRGSRSATPAPPGGWAAPEA